MNLTVRYKQWQECMRKQIDKMILEFDLTIDYIEPKDYNHELYYIIMRHPYTFAENEIADHIKMDFEMFRCILIACGAIKSGDINSEFYFLNKKDAELAIKALMMALIDSKKVIA